MTNLQIKTPKITLISAGIFIALAMVCSGWYMTSNKLDNYIANDTKYRQLRLDTAQSDLQHYFDITDSLYSAKPDMRKNVVETEEQNRRNLEMLQQARQMEIEATHIKRKVYKK